MAIDTVNGEQGPSELLSDLLRIDAEKCDVITSTPQDTAGSVQRTDADLRNW